MRKGNVTAEKIYFSRQSRATDAEIEALAVDIRDNGLQFPVLVDAHSGLLVDGLNRFLAYKVLGWSVVPALFFDSLTEAADELVKIRGDSMLSYRRTMELYSDFRKISHDTDGRRRQGAIRGTKLQKYERSRIATARAAGISENSIARVSVLIGLADGGNHEAEKIVADIYASPPGSPIVGFGRARELRRAMRDVIPMETGERAKVLLDILRATETSLKQVPRVGGIHTLSPADSKTLLARLKDISQLITAINKELKQRSQSE